MQSQLTDLREKLTKLGRSEISRTTVASCVPALFFSVISPDTEPRSAFTEITSLVKQKAATDQALEIP